MSLTIKPRECIKKVVRHNHATFPSSIRGLIVGKSGCGKTTLMMNLLTRDGWLDYDNLLVFGKALYQPEYRALKAAFEAKLSKQTIDKMFDKMVEIDRIGMSLTDFVKVLPPEDSEIECEYYEDCNDIPDPSEIDACRKNLIIFDDCMLGKQNKIESFYTRGRHNNVDCFYLSQNYFRLPRNTIRENSNFIVLFRQDGKSISHIYQDHCAVDMSLQEFKNLCAKAWSKPHNFLTIDLSKDKANGKYKLNLDTLSL